jgi:hypothetical protein
VEEVDSHHRTIASVTAHLQAPLHKTAHDHQHKQKAVTRELIKEERPARKFGRMAALFLNQTNCVLVRRKNVDHELTL